MRPEELLARLEDLGRARDAKLEELLRYVRVMAGGKEPLPERLTISRDTLAVIRGALETYEAIEVARGIRTAELAEALRSSPPREDRFQRTERDLSALAATMRLTILEIDLVLEECELPAEPYGNLLRARRNTGQALLDRIHRRGLADLQRRIDAVARKVAREKTQESVGPEQEVSRG